MPVAYLTVHVTRVAFRLRLTVQLTFAARPGRPAAPAVPFGPVSPLRPGAPVGPVSGAAMATGSLSALAGVRRAVKAGVTRQASAVPTSAAVAV